MSDDTEKVNRLEEAYAPDVVQELPGRVPGPWCWLLIGVCLLLLVLLRVGILRGGMEQAAVNITTAVLVLVSLATLQVWFLFFSGYSASARYGASGALFLLLVILAAIYRIDDVSGDLVPTFAFRWHARPDRLLDKPSGERAAVDLSTTSDQDFPQFLGPHRGNRVDSVTLADNWTEKPPELLWRIPIGAGWSSFAVVNGYAVTMEQRDQEELITCYEVATGKLCWWHAISARHHTLLGGVGPRSTPTISGGKVYALGATGVLRCVDGATGNLLWSDNLLARIHVDPDEDLDAIAWGRASSPLVVDQLVVVPLGGPVNGPWNTLAAFDKDSGRLDWIGGERQASYSSPRLATLGGQRQILIVCQDYVGGYAVGSGQNLWEHPWPGSSNTNANVSQVVPVGNDRLLLSKGYGGGSQLLHVSLEGNDRWSVKLVWEDSRVLRTKFSNTVIHAGYIYGLSDGILQCVDLESGRRVWKGGRYEQGQILGVGRFLMVQAEAGDVFLVLATPEGHRELGSIPALRGKTWNNPALFGKHLLVRNAEHAACYRLP